MSNTMTLAERKAHGELFAQPHIVSMVWACLRMTGACSRERLMAACGVDSFAEMGHALNALGATEGGGLWTLPDEEIHGAPCAAK